MLPYAVHVGLQWQLAGVVAVSTSLLDETVGSSLREETVSALLREAPVLSLSLSFYLDILPYYSTRIP
jgi:hypothetical protein